MPDVAPPAPDLMDTEAAAEALVCACCTFGNHTELCTCDGSSCCHPAEHGAQRDRLLSRLIAVRAEAEGLAEAMANADRLYTEHLAEMRAKAAAVRALHHPVTITGQVWCDECSTQRSTGPRTWDRIAYMPHPCPTVRALDGETA